MGEIFTLTLTNVIKMLLFIGVGYIFSHTGRFPKDASKTLSTLATMLLLPAYNIKNFSQNFTVDKVGENLLILGFGIVCMLAVMGLAWLLAKRLGKTDLERRTLIYAYTIPNYAYFGYPLIEAVFGSAFLADVMVFTLPFAILTNTYGYWILTRGTKITTKKLLTTPVVWAPFIGITLGLTQLPLPEIVTGLLSSSAACMSPISMLLAGFALGNTKFHKLFTSGRAYFLSAIRMVGIPLVFFVILFFSGLRGDFLIIPLMVMSMPIGVNTVVFPESCGEDATDNARLLCISYIMALVFLPLVFSLITQLATL